MSAPTVRPSVMRRLPRTVAWAVALAAFAGLLTMTTQGWWVGSAAAAGMAIGVTIAWFGGNHWRVALGAATLLLAAVALASILIAADAVMRTVLLSLAATVVGAGGVLAVHGGVEQRVLRRVGWGGAVGGGAAAIAAVAAAVVARAGGVGAALEAPYGVVSVVNGGGVLATLLGIVLAGLALGLAIVTFPTRARGNQRAVNSRVARRNTPARFAITGSLAVALLLAILVAIDRLVFSSLGVDAAVGAGIVHQLLMLATVGSLGVALLSAAVRSGWDRSDAIDGVAVPTSLGAIVGIVLAALLVQGFGGADTLVPTFLLTAVALAIVWVGLDVPGSLVSTGVAVAIALAVGGLTLGLDVDYTAGIGAFVRESIPALIALTAAVFVFDVTAYGRTLGRSVGSLSADRRPQIARIGWSFVVCATGAVVALGLAALIPMAAPVLSVPATIAAVLAAITLVTAILVLVW